MIRNSILYHRFWYFKRRNARRLGFYISAISLVIIFFMFAFYAEKTLFPYIVQASEYKAQSLVTLTVNRAVDSIFTDGVQYEDIAAVNKDGSGRITSVQTNIVKLNRLTGKISLDVQEKLSMLGGEDIRIPLGALFGKPMFASFGPNINVKIVPAGSVETDVKSDFESAGINQTRHRITLQVRTKVGIVFPMLEKRTEIVTHIPLAETVIVGNVPNIYTGSISK